MLTRTGGYALNAALAIAEQSGQDRSISATSLAEELDIPYNYLAKILRSLARDGVLVSGRGRTGGFRLARPADEIRLLEVVAGFDDLGKARQCLLGRGTCSDAGGCPAHEEWRVASAPAFRFFESHTLADLLSRPTLVDVPGPD